MYLKRTDANKLFAEFKNNTISELKESSEFLCKLVEQDDWSFVIKLHAYIETIITQLIISTLDEPKLEKFVKRLPLSENYSGKIGIIKDLELLSSEKQKFIRWFSELRNNLVHNVENIEFDLKSYFTDLDKNKRKSSYEAILWSIDNDEEKSKNFEYLSINPKIVILIYVDLFVAHCTIDLNRLKKKKKTDKLSEEAMTEFFEKHA